VALQPVTDEVHRAVRAALEGAEWRRVIPAGVTVSRKVNPGSDLFLPGSITSTQVIETTFHQRGVPTCVVYTPGVWS